MLRDLGYRFDAQAADLPETPGAGEGPLEFVRRLAFAKARAVAARLSDGKPVLGADTDVSIGGRILGKPENQEHCIEMLMSLSGRMHEVTTAVAWVSSAGERELITVTEIEFAPIRLADAKTYWESGEPLDKAGGYAVQGRAARWVRSVKGSYTGVVGLPLCETCELLEQAGIRPMTGNPLEVSR